jgi:hypothetical protein
MVRSYDIAAIKYPQGEREERERSEKGERIGRIESGYNPK